jgi:hypothetical protein|tara:strand:+ start:69 stop:272 length:204 start_codon:yes stop_codon:yes gene_type:complete
MSRPCTNLLLDKVEQQLLDKDQVIMAFSKYLSEDQVRDMMEANEMLSQDDEIILWRTRSTKEHRPLY